MTVILLKSIQMLLFCNTVACTILRLPCKQHANFSIVREGFILQGSAIDSIEGLTDIECKIECFKNDRCKSINMEQHHGGMCQLNSKSTVEMAGGMNALVPKQNWTYASTDYNEHLIGLNCQKQKPCRDGQICKDICHCPGYQCLPGLKGCIAAQTKGYKASGIYRISNSAFVAGWLSVFCDLEADGGGWIVMQRRVDDTVNFKRGWVDYKNGFGNMAADGNFWLGLRNLHALAAPGRGATLRVTIKHRNLGNLTYHALYGNFEIGSESDGYRLTIGGYSGNAGDSLAYHNNMKFSTYDEDNDLDDDGNCAERFEGAWWYAECHISNLNGLYPKQPLQYPETPKYMTWKSLTESYGEITYSEMKLRVL